jgi:hypothetical protein
MTEAIEQHNLRDLASTINTEHEHVYDDVVSALGHAIQCGIKLAEAKAIVPEGSWERWCEHNLSISKSQVGRYMRLAVYRDDLLSGPVPPRSIHAALIQLKGLATTSDRRAIDVEEAKQYREIGATYEEIGGVFGTTGSAVWQTLNPEAAAEISRKTRRKQAISRRQQKEAQQIIQVETVGGALADAFALLQDAAAALEQAVKVSVESRRDALERALTYVQRAEAAIVAATKSKGKK